MTEVRKGMLIAAVSMAKISKDNSGVGPAETVVECQIVESGPDFHTKRTAILGRALIRAAFDFPGYAYLSSTVFDYPLDSVET